MAEVTVDKKVPDYTLIVGEDQRITNQELLGKNVVLYFYPKDNTPGCSQESRDFASLHADFKKANTEIFGISRDSLKSHAKFIDKLELPFALHSDQDETLCQLFNVIWPKNMFGKIVNGIVRSTFLIDSDGVLKQAWRKVKVKGHAQIVLSAAQDL